MIEADETRKPWGVIPGLDGYLCMIILVYEMPGCIVCVCCGEVCWGLKPKWTLSEELSLFLGESLKITSVYRGSATMRQCWGQRWASLLFLFHLWSKHFTLRHTPMDSLTPNLSYTRVTGWCSPVIGIADKWQRSGGLNAHNVIIFMFFLIFQHFL